MKGNELVLEGRTSPFNQAEMISLRLKLLSHSDNLSGLVSILSELLEAPVASNLDVGNNENG